jgi:hypothetical protein
VEGNIDLLGILGLDSDVRTGWRQIRVSFTVDGDATPEQLGALVEQSLPCKRRRLDPSTAGAGQLVANGLLIGSDYHGSTALPLRSARSCAPSETGYDSHTARGDLGDYAGAAIAPPAETAPESPWLPAAYHQ